MSFDPVWSKSDFAIGYEQLVRLEGLLISAALNTYTDLKIVAIQTAQLVRVACLIANEVFEYHHQENIPLTIANLVASALVPEKVPVRFNDVPVEIQPELVDLTSYSSPTHILLHSARTMFISQMLPVPDGLSLGWSQRPEFLEVVENFQYVFACVSPRSHDSSVREAAHSIELVFRAASAIVRGRDTQEAPESYKRYIAGKLRGAVAQYTIGIDNL